MFRIRKGDIVSVLSGKDRGKTGRVLAVAPSKGRAIVEGVNFIKKHMRKTRQDQTGGIIQKEAPIQLSNLALLCKSCNRPGRIGFRKLEDGTKIRYCKRCKETI
jgi:large subunit ribosomal protein L24